MKFLFSQFSVVSRKGSIMPNCRMITVFQYTEVLSWVDLEMVGYNFITALTPEREWRTFITGSVEIFDVTRAPCDVNETANQPRICISGSVPQREEVVTLRLACDFASPNCVNLDHYRDLMPCNRTGNREGQRTMAWVSALLCQLLECPWRLLINSPLRWLRFRSDLSSLVWLISSP